MHPRPLTPPQPKDWPEAKHSPPRSCLNISSNLKIWTLFYLKGLPEIARCVFPLKYRTISIQSMLSKCQGTLRVSDILRCRKVLSGRGRSPCLSVLACSCVLHVGVVHHLEFLMTLASWKGAKMMGIPFWAVPAGYWKKQLFLKEICFVLPEKHDSYIHIYIYMYTYTYYKYSAYINVYYISVTFDTFSPRHVNKKCTAVLEVQQHNFEMWLFGKCSFIKLEDFCVWNSWRLSMRSFFFMDLPRLPMLNASNLAKWSAI